MKRMQRRAAALVGGTAAALLALTGCGGGAGGSAEGETITLHVASWASPNSISEYMADWWYAEIEDRTDGRVTFDVAAGDTLCSASEIPECVRDGRADVGQTLTDYSSQLFPMASVASIPFLSPGSEVVANAIYDLGTEHEGAAALWEQNGLQPLAHIPPGRLLLGGHEDLNSVESLEGLRLRMAGQYAQQAVDAAGASSVALTAPETFEGLQRGVADAAGFPLDGTIAYQLKDILPEWTDPGVGTYTTIGMWMNKDVYDGLPEDIRQVVDEVTEEFVREAAPRIYSETGEGHCDQLLETVGDLKQWDDAETEKWRAALESEDIEAKWIAAAEKDGLKDAEGYLAAYKEKLAEYEATSTQVDPAIACATR